MHEWEITVCSANRIEEVEENMQHYVYPHKRLIELNLGA